MKRFVFVWACVLSLSLAALAAHAAAPAPGGAETKGFEEFPLGDEHKVGPLTIAGVYFQPVDMEPVGMGLPAAQSDMHLEADISANEDNKLGYGGFMPMSASDGPHYGNNVKLDGPGKYKITFIVENPAKQNYLLHVDKETGVPGRFWDKPIEVSWDFDFVPRAWK